MSKPENYAFLVIDLELPEFTQVFLPEAHYQSVAEIIMTLNETLSKFFQLKGLTHDTIQFKYDPLTEYVTYKGLYGYGINLSRELLEILGFPQDVVLPHRKESDEQSQTFHEVPATFKSSIDRGFHALYVYCSICKPQIVGDIYAPLLRTVAVKGKRNEHVTIAYNPPHYVPVGIREISEIEIDIRDDTGGIVPFTFGKVVCKLHFKPNEALYS